MTPSETLLFCLAISISTGLVQVILGYLIAVKQKQHWINGVDFSKLSNPSEFTKAIGRSLIHSGVLFFIVSFLLYVELIGYFTFALIHTLVSFLPIWAFIQAQKKYA